MQYALGKQVEKISAYKAIAEIPVTKWKKTLFKLHILTWFLILGSVFLLQLDIEFQKH